MSVQGLPPVAVVAKPAMVELDTAAIGDVVRALSLATDHRRYAIAPSVVASSAKMTVDLFGSADEVWRDGLAALRLAGVEGRCDVRLCRFSTIEQHLDAAKPEVPQAVLSYRPLHRDVAFLASALPGLFQGWHFAGAAGVGQGNPVSAPVGSPMVGGGGSGGYGRAPGGLSSAMAGRASPQEAVPVRLVAMGPAVERAKVMAALAELDQPVEALTVHVGVYEVDVSQTDQSAVQLVGSILGQALSLGGSAAASLSTSGLAGLTLKVGSFQAVAAALDSSARVHAVTEPVLRTSSGVMASFAVGNSVPTLGSVSYAGVGSTPVQSIEYQQTGVEFSVVPQVVGDRVDVALYQSISSFAATTVGVTASPTLSNRVLSSDVQVAPGGVVVLGGLIQNNDTKNTAGFWFFPRLAKDREQVRTQLVLVLSVDVESGR